MRLVVPQKIEWFQNRNIFSWRGGSWGGNFTEMPIVLSSESPPTMGMVAACVDFMAAVCGGYRDV